MALGAEMGGGLLVSAGEASGDRIAALALRSLGANTGAFGMGGTGCRATKMDIIVDLSDVAAMGWLPVARKAWTFGHAFWALEQAARRRRPNTALLVGFTSFNQALGRRLRRRGVRVVWCVAPQVWAWRPSRLSSLASSVDSLAVILPFEEKLWAERGYDVRYVGHPALEITAWRADTRQTRPSLAILTGSRDQEVRATAGPFLRAARMWCREKGWQADCIVARSLSAPVERWLRKRADALGIACTSADPTVGAAPHLPRHTYALCASGTASLEAAISGVVPVVGYRCDPLTALVAKRLLRTPYIGLPNILLQQRVFSELVQREMHAKAVVDALGQAEGQHPRMREACRRVRELLAIEDGKVFGDRVAELVAGPRRSLGSR